MNFTACVIQAGCQVSCCASLIAIFMVVARHRLSFFLYVSSVARETHLALDDRQYYACAGTVITMRQLPSVKSYLSSELIDRCVQCIHTYDFHKY